MEVIQLDDDDDDFMQSVNPSAPRKSNPRPSDSKDSKASKRPPPISTRIDSDPILKSSSSSVDASDDECPICGRDLRLLNEQRRTLHLNSCLDNGEAKTDLDKKMETWNSTMDCPVCKTPLAAGPFRSAHIKKCGREHAINGRDLLNLVTTQEKVTETRRKRALPHTSAKTPKLRPKKVSKLDGEPKTMAEEEMLMAKALSASLMEPGELEKEEEEKRKEEQGVSPVFTRIINDNIRKRRSYAVVELAPRGCRCDVIEMIQSRFLRVFRARRSSKVVLKRAEEGKKKKGEEEKKEKKEKEDVKERLAAGERRTLDRVHSEAAMAVQLARLDTLSWAYRNLAADGEQRGDATIECSDGEIRAFSWALLARTTALGRAAAENTRISIAHPTTVVRHWLQYVQCARVEWAAGAENDAMRAIARQHGPEDLAEACARMATTRVERRGFGDRVALDTVATTAVPASGATIPPPPAAVEEEQSPLPGDDAIVVEDKEEEEEKRSSERTMDSEGSCSGALKKCAAAAAGARASSPRPFDGSLLAALEAPPPPPTVVITVPPRESPTDSFFDSVVRGGATPSGNQLAIEVAVPTVISPPSSSVGAQPQTTRGESSAESMDEGDAMRNILDVSCLRRSPVIRLDDDARQREESALSPELFCDESDEGGREQQRRPEMSPTVPAPSPPPRHRSLAQSIMPAADTVTPTTSSRPTRARRSSLAKKQEVIVLDDTPVCSPVTVAAGTVLIETKKEETVDDESFPRVDQPSYGGGGLDTVDGGGEEEERGEGVNPVEVMGSGGVEGNNDGEFHDDFYAGGDFQDCNWDNDGQGVDTEMEEGEEECVAARAQEEVDSFLQSLRWNETRGGDTAGTSSKTTSPPPADDVVDSFLLSMRRGLEETKEEEEGTSGDILGALSPVRKEPEPGFKTPVVRGGARGRGRGALFGSHVKVLKWSNVTPRPQFEAMDDAALKAQLARYGLRPMGRKRAIAMLAEIYEQTHPVVDEGAAGSNSAAAAAASDAAGDVSPTRKKRTAPVEEAEVEEENDGERTLNRGADSSEEDEDDRAGGCAGEAEESMHIPKASLKGADNQLVLFLEWLRAPPQKDLYDHCLALKSISLEELEVKLKRADSALCGISRKVLMCVLDRLHITYSLSQDGWKRKRKGK